METAKGLMRNENSPIPKSLDDYTTEEFHEMLKESIKKAKECRGTPIDDVIEQMNKKYGICITR